MRKRREESTVVEYAQILMKVERSSLKRKGNLDDLYRPWERKSNQDSKQKE